MTRRTGAYQSWSGMKTRCYNKNRVQYCDYGGRGITVCDRWQQYDNFLADMGERPEGASLDRINVDGNYEPGNCRWADSRTQTNNARSNVRITLDGVTKNLSTWCREKRINISTIKTRIRRGMTWNAAFSVPAGGVWALKKTHCAQGHSWIPENISKSNRGKRFCKICSRANAAAYRKRRAA